MWCCCCALLLVASLLSGDVSITGSITRWNHFRLPWCHRCCKVRTSETLDVHACQAPPPPISGCTLCNTRAAIERRPRYVKSTISHGTPPHLHPIRHGGVADHDPEDNTGARPARNPSGGHWGNQRRLDRISHKPQDRERRTKTNDDEEGGPDPNQLRS